MAIDIERLRRAGYPEGLSPEEREEFDAAREAVAAAGEFDAAGEWSASLEDMYDAENDD